jgi:phosphohistidine phosphatase
MAKHLLLVRHAEAASREGRQDDKTRELTPAGVKESLHLGAWLAENNFSFDLIVSSSALRAEQTASIVAEGMKLEQPKILLDDILYEASARQLLDHINNIEDAYGDVLLVAHNPAISYLAEYLTKADIGDMLPCSAAIIKFDLPSWKLVSENTGALEKYVTAETAARF